MATNESRAESSSDSGIPLDNRLIGHYDDSGGVVPLTGTERLPASAPVYVAYAAGETANILTLSHSPIALYDHPGVDTDHPDTRFAVAAHRPAGDELQNGCEAVLSFDGPESALNIDPLADTSQATLAAYAMERGLPGEVADRLLDELYRRVSSCKRQSGKGNIVVQRQDNELLLRVGFGLFRRQPMGVICRPIHRALRDGEAVLADATPRSATVEEAILAEAHIAFSIVPTPVWLGQHFG